MSTLSDFTPFPLFTGPSDVGELRNYLNQLIRYTNNLSQGVSNEAFDNINMGDLEFGATRNDQDQASSIAAAVSLWNTIGGPSPTSRTPPYTARSLFVPGGMFASTAFYAIAPNDSAAAMYGTGFPSQLYNVGIKVTRRYNQFSHFLLSGPGNYGFQFDSAPHNSQILGVGIIGQNDTVDPLDPIFNGKTIALEHIADVPAEIIITNLGAEYFDWGQYCHFINAIVGQSTVSHAQYDNLVVLGSGQSKWCNINYNGANRYNARWSGYKSHSVLNQYIVNPTFSGAGETLIMPFVSVADANSIDGTWTAGTAALRLAVPLTISTPYVVNAGGRLWTNFENKDPQPTTYFKISAVTGASSITQITVGATTLLSAPVVSAGTDAEIFVIALVAAINANTGTTGVTAEALRLKIRLSVAENDLASNWKAVVIAPVTGTAGLTYDYLDAVEFTLAAPTTITSGTYFRINGVVGVGAELNKSHEAVYVSADGLTLGTLYNYPYGGAATAADFTTTPATMSPDYFPVLRKKWTVNDAGTYNLTETEIVHISENLEYVATSMPFTSTSTGTMRHENWDVVLDAKEKGNTVQQWYCIGGNINNFISKAAATVLILSRVKQAFVVVDRANADMRTKLLFRIGLGLGEDIDDEEPSSRTTVDISGAPYGWGECIMGDEGPGDPYVRIASPSTSQGMHDNQAAFKNRFATYQDRIIMAAEGTNLTYDGTRFSCAGAATNIGLELKSKGSGKLRLIDGGGTTRVSADTNGARLSVPAAAPIDASLMASQVTFWVNEPGSLLTFKVKYADGTTIKSGAVAIV